MSAGLSIVVPTYGRQDLVKALLESISEDAGNTDFDVEVIIVDDSPASDAAAIRTIGEAYGAIVYDSPTQNVGGKRNFGLQQASHDLVLFLDSDVTIRLGTLDAHVRRLVDSGNDVAGCLGKVEFVGKETYAWRVIEAMQLTLPFSYPDVSVYVPWGPTANLSVRRASFLEVGGFDTTMPRYGGEDVDLGLRLADRGLRIITCSEAVAEHAIETWSTWRQNLHRLWSFGLADYHLLIRHPSRSFFDFPTGPMLWTAQLLLLCVLVATNAVPPLTAPCALIASLVAYPVVYALLKRHAGTSLRVHLLGPVIFWIMDAAKAWEATRRGHLALVFRRLRFLDDLIAQDWHEVAASAWALSAAAIAFVGVIMTERILH